MRRPRPCSRRSMRLAAVLDRVLQPFDRLRRRAVARSPSSTTRCFESIASRCCVTQLGRAARSERLVDGPSYAARAAVESPPRHRWPSPPRPPRSAPRSGAAPPRPGRSASDGRVTCLEPEADVVERSAGSRSWRPRRRPARPGRGSRPPAAPRGPAASGAASGAEPRPPVPTRRPIAAIPPGRRPSPCPRAGERIRAQALVGVRLEASPQLLVPRHQRVHHAVHLIHRRDPVASGPSPGPSIPSCRRSAAMARNWRPRIVPSCLPITTAASRAERPAKKRSAMASRCSSVSVVERRRDRVDVLSCRGDLVRSRRLRRALAERIEVGVLVAGPHVIDDRVPGQPEEPAPERDAPRLVSRQRLQGLDEDGLRQVLRVRRALDAAGDVAIDRQVEVVEDPPEGVGIAGPSPVPRAARSRHRRGSQRIPPCRVRSGRRSGPGSATATPAPPAPEGELAEPGTRPPPRTPSSSPQANSPPRWASEPTVTRRPPSSRKRATTAGDGYVSPGAWRRPLVLTSSAVPPRRAPGGSARTAPGRAARSAGVTRAATR